MATNEADTGAQRRGRLVVIAGTGTSIGKTHVAQALILAWRSRTVRRVVGLKPVESGVREGNATDEARLGDVSSFHVKHSPYRLAAGLSPHLAARDEGITIRLGKITTFVERAREGADAVVELPGGLFTPLAADILNADLVVALAPDWVVLVAPDRLGVLHDVVATTRAAETKSVRIDGVVIVAPDRGDESTGRNADEIALFAGIPVWGVIPRGSPAELSQLPMVRSLVERIAGKW
jgi:dethiobiotin synthetase